MSRYTGPRRRIVRRLDAELPGLTNPAPQLSDTRRTYLERADDGLGGTCAGLPDRQDVPVQVDERMLVEFYAR